MKRPIRVLGDGVLRKRAAPVTRITQEIRDLVKDMYESMDAAHGVGLAAPQVGVSKRVIVVSIPEEDGPPVRMAIVNPEIVSYFGEDVCREEGCLSVPGVSAEVSRPEGVRVRGKDPEKNAKIDFQAEGLFARCLMHEIDHLDGKLFIDGDRAGVPEKAALAQMKARRDETEESDGERL